MSYTMRVSSLDHAPTQSSTLLAGESSSGAFCAGFPCCAAFNHATLYVTASVIWLLGVFATAADGMKHFKQAKDSGATHGQMVGTLVSSLLLGLLGGYFGFCLLANRNIDRIGTLEKPQWWECFRARLWLFLILFDGGTIYLFNNVAQGTSNTDIVWQLIFSGIDYFVAMGLLVSFFVYPYRWSSFCIKVQALSEPLIPGDLKGPLSDNNA
jgi:hypothetical protein